LIENNLISSNSVSGEYHKGGGFYGCGGIVEKNIVRDNVADFGGGLSGCGGIIRNNIIVGNSAVRSSGGLVSCNGTTENNTVYGNSAGDKGGGLFECNGIIRNCIVWANTAKSGAQILYSLDLARPRYCCIEGWRGGGQGNIADNPLFVDPDGPDNESTTYAHNHYHLRPDSPCIDAGTHKAIVPPNTDMDGEWRPFGEEIDIGADECVDADQDGLSDYWEIDWFGTLWLEAEDDVDADGLPNGQEFVWGTNPENRDTDDDGKSDGDEVFAGTNPLDRESLFRIVEIVYTRSGAAVRWSAAGGRFTR